MIEKRYCDRIAGRIASAAAKVRGPKTVLVTAATVGVLSVTAYVFHRRSVPAPPLPPTPMQDEAKTSRATDSSESSLLGEAPLVGRLTTESVQTESPPPFGIQPGRQPSEANAPDLSTPATAVHGVLALIDRGAADQLSQCFAPGTEDVASGLYPRYVGHPVELVEVAEESTTAKVFWKAAVHTGFTLEGRNWSPGETITLETRLVCVEGVWKLARLCEHNP